ncbi:MAG: helix-turn-helix transcriptional regulator [Oligoflexia bacterium]|nr:helix-turn-helix transcriptional regulator [Oligoflexia bacterium]
MHHLIMASDKGYDRLLKKVAENVKRLRKKQGITQEGMTDFGFNYRHYQKIEGGEYSFNLFTLHRLSQAFKVEIKEFFKD